MKLLVAFPDVERLVVDYLSDEMDEPDVTVGVAVPVDWTTESDPHLQVITDGTPSMVPPVIANATVRLLARAASTTEAKRIAAKALGVLSAHPGGEGIAAIVPLTGVLPARDPDTFAELASVTCRVTVRSTPIEPSGS